MEPVFDPEPQELADAPSSGPEQLSASYGGPTERRRQGIARSTFLAILAAVLAFSAAVAIATVPASEASISSTSSADHRTAIRELSASPLCPNESPSDEPTRIHAPRIEKPSIDAELADSATPPLPYTVTESDVSTDTSNQTEAEQRGQAALKLISYPWAERLPCWEISFHPPKPGLYGLTIVSEKRIEIYLRDGESESLLAHVLAHEIGHALDVTHNDGPDRRVWTAARDIESAQWWPGDGATDFATGAGDFAEAFAAWQVGDDHFRSKVAGPPSPEQVEIIETLID